MESLLTITYRPLHDLSSTFLPHLLPYFLLTVLQPDLPSYASLNDLGGCSYVCLEFSLQNRYFLLNIQVSFQIASCQGGLLTQINSFPYFHHIVNCFVVSSSYHILQFEIALFTHLIPMSSKQIVRSTEWYILFTTVNPVLKTVPNTYQILIRYSLNE